METKIVSTSKVYQFVQAIILTSHFLQKVVVTLNGKHIVFIPCYKAVSEPAPLKATLACY